MSRSTIVIYGTLALSCIIFALSPGPVHLWRNLTAWELREQLVYLTGVCSVTLMAVSMLISARIPWISHLLQGLDKGYVVHRWTGTFAALFILSHFLLENVPHWLVALGIVSNPGELTDGSQYNALEIGLFQAGVMLAQPAFYTMLVLIAISLIKKIPYHWFRKSHKLFPVVFLLGAYHSATAQLKEHWLGWPGSYMLMIVLCLGSVAAIIALFGAIGTARRVQATISSIDHPADQILDITLTVDSRHFQHKPGQYVFLKFLHDKEPHPFSIASWDADNRKLRFAVKALGDFTSRLPEHLQVGDAVQVEGPYGEFTFDDDCKRQVWIAGGIGVTPFMARLEHLARHTTPQPVDFWYATRNDKHASFPLQLEQWCTTRGVTLYHSNSSRREYVTVELIRETIGNLNNTSIWFCGPEEFAACIMNDLKSAGFNMQHFHYDSFSMR